MSDRSESGVVQELSDARVLQAIEALVNEAVDPYLLSDIVPETLAQIGGKVKPIGVPFYEAGVITDRVNGVNTGNYDDAFDFDVTGDQLNRTITVNVYPRPSRCAEVIQINVVRQLVEG